MRTTVEKGDISAPVTLRECARPVLDPLPTFCGGDPSFVRLAISGMDRVFRSFRGPEACETDAWVLDPDGVLPFLNMDGNACMLIRERRLARGEFEVSLGDVDEVIRSSISAALAAGAESSRRLEIGSIRRQRYFED